MCSFFSLSLMFFFVENRSLGTPAVGCFWVRSLGTHAVGCFCIQFDSSKSSDRPFAGVPERAYAEDAARGKTAGTHTKVSFEKASDQ